MEFARHTAKHSASLKILAAASEGGHWVQLLRVRPAFATAQVRYLTTNADLGRQVAPAGCYVVADASMDSKFSLIVAAVQVLFHVLRYRPDVVISTGAAPGFMAIVFGKIVGARTIWIDSVANSEELSLAGRKVRRWADHWLTQWPELACPEGPHYIGAVL